MSGVSGGPCLSGCEHSPGPGRREGRGEGGDIKSSCVTEYSSIEMGLIYMEL